MPKRKPRSIRHHCRGRPSHAPPRSGTESLFDKSMRSLLLKSHSLQAETLKHVPKYYVGRIYDAAKRHECLTIHLWQILVDIGLESVQSLSHQIRLWFGRDSFVPLATLPTINPDSTWLSHLTFSNMPAELFDMDAIASVTNLETLHFYWETKTETPLNDRVIRSWSQQAQERKVFTKLKVLSFTGALGVSVYSCADLAKLPALEHVLFVECHSNLFNYDRGALVPLTGWTKRRKIPASLSYPDQLTALDALAENSGTIAREGLKLRLRVGQKRARRRMNATLLLERDGSSDQEEPPKPQTKEKQPRNVRKRPRNDDKAADAMDLISNSLG